MFRNKSMFSFYSNPNWYAMDRWLDAIGTSIYQAPLNTDQKQYVKNNYSVQREVGEKIVVPRISQDLIVDTNMDRSFCSADVFTLKKLFDILVGWFATFLSDENNNEDENRPSTGMRR